MAGCITVALLLMANADEILFDKIPNPIKEKMIDQFIRKETAVECLPDWPRLRKRILDDERLGNMFSRNLTCFKSAISKQIYSRFQPYDPVFAEAMALPIRVFERCLQSIREQTTNKLWNQLASLAGPEIACPWVVGGHDWAGKGGFDAFWIQFADFCHNLPEFCREAGLTDGAALEPIRLLSERSGYWWMMKSHCIISARPQKIEIDQNYRFHNISGPVVQYEDGWSFHAIHGRWLLPSSEAFVQNMDLSTIEKEINVEARREMIELYGIERYIRDCQVEKFQEDSYGTLYRKELPDDEPLMILRVTNASPEEDGSYKDYFLRVPPDVRTAHEAVAWTFGLDADLYEPTRET